MITTQTGSVATKVSIADMEDNSIYTIGRIISKRVLPVLLLFLCFALWDVLDAILVARFAGIRAMQIVVMTAPLLFFVAGIYDDISYGTSVLFTHLQGENNRPAAARVIQNGFTHALIWALVFAGGGIASRKLLVGLFGIPEDLQAMTLRYFVWLFPGLGLYIIGHFLSHIVELDNQPQLCTIAKAIQVVICIGLSVLLMGYYNMGVVGFGIAYLVASGVWSAVLSLHFGLRKSLFRLYPVWPDWQIAKKLFGFIRNSITEDLCFALTLLMMNHLIQRMPEEFSALYFIVVEIFMFFAFIAFGLAQTVAPLMGVYYGEKNSNAVLFCYHKLQRISLKVAIGAGGAAGARDSVDCQSLQLSLPGYDG